MWSQTSSLGYIYASMVYGILRARQNIRCIVIIPLRDLWFADLRLFPPLPSPPSSKRQVVWFWLDGWDLRRDAVHLSCSNFYPKNREFILRVYLRKSSTMFLLFDAHKKNIHSTHLYVLRQTEKKKKNSNLKTPARCAGLDGQGRKL